MKTVRQLEIQASIKTRGLLKDLILKFLRGECHRISLMYKKELQTKHKMEESRISKPLEWLPPKITITLKLKH